MEYYAIINKTSHSIIANYYSDSGVDYTKPGISYDQSILVHVVVPSEFQRPHVIVVQSETEVTGYSFQIEEKMVEQAIKEQWSHMRQQRDLKLRDSDWRVSVSDYPQSSENKAAWITYRQALRELPSNTSDPSNIIWPAPPK